MSDWKSIKQEVFALITGQVNQTIADAEQNILLLDESKTSDTKSSAGDKYETGRELIQQEQIKYQTQISNAHLLKEVLSSIDIDRRATVVEIGSLLITNAGVFFISIGLGRVEVKNQMVFVISAASPIGGVLKGLNVGESGVFNSKEFKIEAIF